MNALQSKPSTTLIAPLVTFRNNAEIAAADTAAAESLKTPQYIGRLSAYIENCWGAARRAKQNKEQQYLKNQRQRNGEYEPDKLQAIEDQMGGSTVYMMLTATKCRALLAWVADILRPVGENPFSVDPTPIPDLPPDVEDEIKQECMAVFQEVVNQVQQMGPAASLGEIAEEVREYASTRKDEVLCELKEEASIRSKRMMMKINDQLAEGGWYNAFWAVIDDMITLGDGIMKGPVIRKRKVHKWVQDPQTRKWVVKSVEQKVPEFYRVSPFDLYPAPDSRHINDGYLIERHKLTRSDLNALKSVEGYNDEMIDKALHDYSRGLSNTIASDTERADLEFSSGSQALTDSEKIEAIEFWGSVPGSMLIDWGFDAPDINPTGEYEINAWKVGNYVIRAVLNPDRLGRKPYGMDSFERTPGSFWGKGLPELMSDIQDVCNAIARAIVNNAALASGPQVEYDVDRLESEADTLHPWKMWASNSKQMNEGAAVRFYQPQIVVEPLLRIYEFFAAQAEDQTGVPRWAYGNSNIGGAGSTSSGLSMLMTSASRGTKEFISHIDTVTSSCMGRLYDYNMMYDPDESIKGDCNVVARGSAALLAKEQMMLRMKEVLAQTNNPIDTQIMGLEGRAVLLKETFKQMDLPADEIMPDEAKLKKIVQQFQQMQQMQMQQAMAQKGMVPPTNPQALDNAGNPAGNPDGNVFQNQPGSSPGVGGAPAQ